MVVRAKIDSAEYLVWSVRDDCNPFRSPLDSALGRVLGGSVTVDHSRRVSPAASSCRSFQSGAVGSLAVSWACVSVSLSSVSVPCSSLCVSLLRSAVVRCCVSALSGPGRSFFLPMPFGFGALVFTRSGCLSHRVCVFLVDLRPPVGVDHLVVCRGVVVGLPASPSSLLIHSSSSVVPRHLFVSSVHHGVGRVCGLSASQEVLAAAHSSDACNVFAVGSCDDSGVGAPVSDCSGTGSDSCSVCVCVCVGGRRRMQSG